ncbi:MAG: peptidase [Desulfobulbus propionicus]|nr:MAG: peptidase [Desulfobulbus propionicus]
MFSTYTVLSARRFFPLAGRKAAFLSFLLITCICYQGCTDVSVTYFHGHNHEEVPKNVFIVDQKTDVIGTPFTLRIEQGDTLPDIARHFGLGITTLGSANPAIDIWVPESGTMIVLPTSFILPDSRKEGIVINLPALRLFHYGTQNGQLTVSTFPVGAGTVERPTPTGDMHVTRKQYLPTWHVPASIAEDHLEKGDPLPASIPPGPLNPLGKYALYLSRPGYLIHGTNKPASVGLRASNGCVRLYPEDIKLLFSLTSIETPVKIVNQPYLVGQRDGIVYLEAHRPFRELKETGLQDIYKQIADLEKDLKMPFDWDRIDRIVVEARGIPEPIFPAGQLYIKRNTYRQVRHPDVLYGEPQLPTLKADAWYVLAGLMDADIDARRLAAIINHQGPPIPARVISGDGQYRVLAGPFAGNNEAEAVSRRLKIDLDIDSILVAP